MGYMHCVSDLSYGLSFFQFCPTTRIDTCGILVWQRHVPFTYEYVLPSLYLQCVLGLCVCVCCARGMNVVRIDLFCSVRFCCALVCVCVYTMIVTHVVWFVLTAHPCKLLLPLPCINVSNTLCTRIAMPTS